MLSDEEIWNLRGQKVHIELDEGSKKAGKSTEGHLVTRDPVSKSIVLAQFRNDEISRVEWIPGCSVKAINKVEGAEEEQKSIQVDELWREEAREGAKETEEDAKKRAHRIVEYLKSHHLKVIEQPPGVYIIENSVKFEAPYGPDNFYCDIPIVLKNILKLVKNIE